MSSLTTNAVRIHSNGGTEQLKFEEIEVPAPAAGQVRIKNTLIGVNFIDIYFRKGVYPSPQLPLTLGFEAAGIVESIGAGVTHLKAGDRVAYCQGGMGSYAGVKVHTASQVIKLPRFITDEQAAAGMLKGLTVQYLFRQTYRLQGGETVLFHAAAGGVGLIACQWAKALKVKLIGTVSSDEKAAIAKAHGAWETINVKRENFVERVAALTKNAKCPVVYDSVGKDTWAGSLDCIQPRGLMVSFGNSSGPVEGVNLGILSAKGSLFVTRPTLGTHVATLEKLQACSDEMFDLIKRKKLRIDVARSYPLKDAARAHADLESRSTTGASVLVP
jgi:NADPH:quinone reductase